MVLTFENILGSVYVGQWKKGHRHGLGRLLFGPLHNHQAGELLTSIWNYDSNQKQISKAKLNDWVSVSISYTLSLTKLHTKLYAVIQKIMSLKWYKYWNNFTQGDVD